MLRCANVEGIRSARDLRAVQSRTRGRRCATAWERISGPYHTMTECPVFEGFATRRRAGSRVVLRDVRYPHRELASARRRGTMRSMKHYKIEKGFKLPAPSRPKSSGKPSRAAATMQALAVGDSFFISDPLDAIRADMAMRDMSATARATRRLHALTSRRTRGGLKVWRMK